MCLWFLSQFSAFLESTEVEIWVGIFNILQGVLLFLSQQAENLGNKYKVRKCNGIYNRLIVRKAESEFIIIELEKVIAHVIKI